MKLKWSELAGHISGHKISLSLPEGQYLEGNVISVRSDALDMNVSKTSDRSGLGFAFIGTIVGVGVMIAGFFIGNEHDRQLTMITVLPD
jgi:hypothetical protein